MKKIISQSLGNKRAGVYATIVLAAATMQIFIVYFAYQTT